MLLQMEVMEEMDKHKKIEAAEILFLKRGLSWTDEQMEKYKDRVVGISRRLAKVRTTNEQ